MATTYSSIQILGAHKICIITNNHCKYTALLHLSYRITDSNNNKKKKEKKNNWSVLNRY